MENLSKNDNNNDCSGHRYYGRKHTRAGKIMGGLVVVAVGGVLLARQLGAYFPDWIFNWEMILIVIGVFIGAKHSFTGAKWLVPIVIGGVFLIDDFVPGVSISTYFWPVLVIFIGLVMIFKPRRKWGHGHKWGRDGKGYYDDSKYYDDKSTDDKIISTAVFSSIEKTIVSKDFKGGDVTCVFGGAKINLSQADITGTVTMDITHVFGGTQLIVPANWHIQNEEMTAVFGGVEDKRVKQNPSAIDNSKTLIIRGTSVFGGLEIKSY